MQSKKLPVLEEYVEESLRRRALQAWISVSQVTFLPNNEELLLIGIPPGKNESTLCYMNCREMNVSNEPSFLAQQLGLIPSSSSTSSSSTSSSSSNEKILGKNKPQMFEACDFSFLSGLDTKLTKEQILLKERKRESAHGITEYTYHEQSGQIVFQYGPHWMACKLPDRIEKEKSLQPVKIGDMEKDTVGTRMDAQFTSDGEWIVFARNNDLWVTTANPGQLNEWSNPVEVRLTYAQDISENLTAGVCDFIMEEEFNRFTGYWISPNVEKISSGGIECKKYTVLYLECDNSNVPKIDIPSSNGVESHKWPRAGENNCLYTIKLVTFTVPTNRKLSSATEAKLSYHILSRSLYESHPWLEYVVRAGWTERPHECWLQLMDRDQQKTELYLYDTEVDFVAVEETKKKEESNSGCGVCLFDLFGTPWINYHDTYYFGANGAIWLAEHSGFAHLYYIPYPDAKACAQFRAQNVVEKKGKTKLTQDVQMNYGDTDSKSREAKIIEEEKLDQTSTYGSHPTVVNLTFRTPLVSEDKVLTLTSGEWCVNHDSLWYSSELKWLYFIGSKDSHLESHLYAIPFDFEHPAAPSNVLRLTTAGFNHDVQVSSTLRAFACISSNITSPKTFNIFVLPNDVSLSLPSSKSSTQKQDKEEHGFIKKISYEIPALANRPPEWLKYTVPQLVTIKGKSGNDQEKNRDDLTNFTALVYKPFGYESGKQYPTIIYVYGGPHVQIIRNDFTLTTGRSQFQMWRTLGFVVAMIDGRGSNNRGLAFEGRIKYNMGQIEIQDQVALVEYLCKDIKISDPKKIAITGFSYGGYLSLMALCQRPDVFNIVIAGAPVVRWELYDTGYTERYMGTPQEHPNAYNKGSVSYYAQNFPDEENRLIIIHGTADENVHIFHTMRLIDALVKYGKPYVLKIFPEERHGIRGGPNIRYMEKYVLKHLITFL